MFHIQSGDTPGGTPLYKVYRYVPPRKVWFLSRFGLKTGMDFWGQVWKRTWEMAIFGLKLGLDLERRAAHPNQKFQGVPPGGGGTIVDSFDSEKKLNNLSVSTDS